MGPTHVTSQVNHPPGAASASCATVASQLSIRILSFVQLSMKNAIS
jgi:hypothetical protein